MKTFNLFIKTAIASFIFKPIFIVTLILTMIFSLAPFNSIAQNLDGVTIGNQVWMAKNLNVDKFRNGDPIPHARTKEEWKMAVKKGQPAWSYYENDPSNGEKIGKLYNWYAVNDPRGLCPVGWHVPSNNEWTQLTDYLGGVKEAVDKIKSTYGWKDDRNGTNESGFNAFPSQRRNLSGNFTNEYNDVYANWWCSTEQDAKKAWMRGISSGGFSANNVYVGGFPKAIGISVRCVRD